jgi:hypothetical protein
MPLNTRALKFIHFDTPSPLPAAGVVAAPTEPWKRTDGGLEEKKR